MAESEEEVSTEAGTDEEGTESGTEAGESEGSANAAKPPAPPPTELHNSALFVAKYLDQKLDKLFAATEKINVDMAEMEKRIMHELTTNIEANHNALTVRIVALENLTLEHGVKLQQQDNKGAQQAHQLDELQNQDTAKAKGAESPVGTSSEASRGTENESGSETGTESEAASDSQTTEGETTDGDETSGEEDGEVA